MLNRGSVAWKFLFVLTRIADGPFLRRPDRATPGSCVASRCFALGKPLLVLSVSVLGSTRGHFS